MKLSNTRVSQAGNVHIERETFPDNEKISVTTPPPTLYRFMEEPYFSDFLKAGRLRICPLESYRTEVPRSRSDPHEGLASHEFGARNLIRWIATDSYSLSFSSVPLVALQRRFGGKCLKVINPTAFLADLDRRVRELLTRLNHPAVASVANQVAYCDFPNFAFGDAGCAINQAFVKPHIRPADNHHYWIESEYRALWDLGTRDVPLRPIHIESITLCKFLEPLEDAELTPDEAISSLSVRAYTRGDHEVWESQHQK